jgi:adenylate cyclase
MFTDIVGYTALSQRNEALALELLQEHRRLVRPLLAEHRGREVKTMGDAFLVEFASALEATRCAVDIQESLREFNSSRDPERRVLVRVGIHLGDVVVDQGDIYGDAVNIASRIEPLAPPGGICLSEQVFAQIRNKFELPLEKMASRQLKNVELPVTVYRVKMPWEGGESEVTHATAQDRSRIAVLPFSNISPNPNDEYLADGMTEELIDRLSQVKGLKVIARTSVMFYKKKEMKASDIGRELGVGTLVEGSVRKAGNRIRVTVQVIDASTEEHVWSSRYDRDIDDIFAVQSDIAMKITEAMPGSLIAEKPIPPETSPSSVAAYSYFLQARQLLYQRTERSLRQALEMFQEATRLDPRFARAYASMGVCYIELWTKSLISWDEFVKGAKQAAARALELDENLADTHALLAWISWVVDDHVNDEIEAKKAVELNPNLAAAYNMLAAIKATNGYPKEAISLSETAHQLDPLSPRVIMLLGSMYLYRGREREALELWKRNLKFAPLDSLAGIATYHLCRGEYKEAEDVCSQLERDFPNEAAIQAFRGYLQALQGDSSGAQETMRKLREVFGVGAPVEQHIANIKYFLGDLDGYFASMFRVVETHVLDPVDIRYSPLFEGARRDPRYREVMVKNGLDPDLKE